MKPKYVVYECENCGELFYREINRVFVDDGNHVKVEVEILPDETGAPEEFPMCECLGGEPKHINDLIPAE